MNRMGHKVNLYIYIYIYSINRDLNESRKTALKYETIDRICSSGNTNKPFGSDIIYLLHMSLLCQRERKRQISSSSEY